MKPGKSDGRSKDYAELHRPHVQWEVKLAIAMFAFAVLVSFGLGTKVSAIAQKTQSAEACLAP